MPFVTDKAVLDTRMKRDQLWDAKSITATSTTMTLVTLKKLTASAILKLGAVLSSMPSAVLPVAFLFVELSFVRTVK